MTKLPTISVVTATLNRAPFLEPAMRSVLDQGYPALDYVVVDGGSTDESVEIIRKHSDRLAWWISEKDDGHADALNKGFAHTSGDVMAWLNSDDLYTPWAFSVVGEIFAALPQVQWLTTVFQIVWDGDGRATRCKAMEGFSRGGFLRGENLPRADALTSGWIQQESTFWRRSLWEKAGGRVNALDRMTHDFELWARFFEYAELYGVTTPIGGFRSHGDQFTHQQLRRIQDAGLDVIRRHGGKPYGALTSKLFRSKLSRYVPNALRRAMGVRHPMKRIVHRAKEGWAIETV